MPLRHLHSAEDFLYQRSGNESQIPVVYLPGVHGCWTPLEQARPLFAKKLEFIEVAYPSNNNWTLESFSDALLSMLHAMDLESVHLVGESFGSLVAWQFGLTHPSKVRSLTLIGGFCQAPGMYLAGTAGLGLSVLPAVAFDKIVDTYVSYKNTQGETRSVSGVKAYPAVRGSKGQSATANRMRLIQAADFRQQLSRIAFPVRYIGGFSDKVIPVAREIRTMRRLLPKHAAFQSYLIPGAPHAIIASHPDITVEHITRWIMDIESDPE